ncbi:hypothetical protein [Metabacillus fastidiosus]|uniref:hypothetical protein n=1 Tax=Metabacillus fastidiosus TaxID=1458 RepID=UPI000825557E|nr:hypothetical protein [Metabacillus fastidiosus]MED4461836.1 hypothetical protein [Metabacillus fastidiosus]
MSEKVKLKKLPKELKETNNKVISEFTSIENKHRKDAGKGDYSETTKSTVQTGDGYTSYKIADILGITYKSKKSFTPNPHPVEQAIENLKIESSGFRTNILDSYNNGGHGRQIITTHLRYPIDSIKKIKNEIESNSEKQSKGTFLYDGVEFRVLS